MSSGITAKSSGLLELPMLIRLMPFFAANASNLMAFDIK
jgi:hypothetical protein